MNGATTLCLVLAVLATAWTWAALAATKGERTPATVMPASYEDYRRQLKRESNDAMTSLMLALSLFFWVVTLVLLIVKWIFG